MKTKRIIFGVLSILSLYSNELAVADNSQDIYTNMALTATASASTEYNGNYDANNINDGIKNQWDTGEWASNGEGAGAWIQLTWGTPVSINRIDVYSRPNHYDMTYDAYLLIETTGDAIADYTLRIGMLPQGGAPKIVYLSSAQGGTVYAIKYLVAEVPSDSLNTGLAEIECYNIRGDNNTALGNRALYSNTSGGLYNTATGYLALYANTSGDYNTANGYGVLYANTTGYGNTASGFDALVANTTGYYNTAIGYATLYDNTTGYHNTAIGFSALANNTTGYGNTASGCRALDTNTTGFYNTAIGIDALYSNTSGDNNTASGRRALYTNTTGYYNTASGTDALYSNTEGYNNTAFGVGTLLLNTTGFENTAIGIDAGDTNTTGYRNTFIGCGADASTNGLSNATAIGYEASVSASNKVRIGDTNVTVIEGAVAWTNPSDFRIKKNITDDYLGLEFILGLRPVHYEMKKGHEGIIYDGLIAQDVEEVMNELGVTFSGLVKPDKPENMYSLSYSTFVVPLINAVKEQQNQIETLDKVVKDQQEKINTLEERLRILEESIGK